MTVCARGKNECCVWQGPLPSFLSTILTVPLLQLENIAAVAKEVVDLFRKEVDLDPKFAAEVQKWTDDSYFKKDHLEAAKHRKEQAFKKANDFQNELRGLQKNAAVVALDKLIGQGGPLQSICWMIIICTIERDGDHMKFTTNKDPKNEDQTEGESTPAQVHLKNSWPAPEMAKLDPVKWKYLKAVTKVCLVGVEPKDVTKQYEDAMLDVIGINSIELKDVGCLGLRPDQPGHAMVISHWDTTQNRWIVKATRYEPAVQIGHKNPEPWRVLCGLQNLSTLPGSNAFTANWSVGQPPISLSDHGVYGVPIESVPNAFEKLTIQAAGESEIADEELDLSHYCGEQHADQCIWFDWW